MRPRLGFLAGGVLLLLGIAAIAAAARSGAVQFYLVVIVPVFSSSSPLFALGVLALVAGIVCLCLSAGEVLPFAESRVGRVNAQRPIESSGLFLIGPVPIFWGDWRPSRRAYWVAVLFGLLLFVGLFLFLWTAR